MKRQIFIAAFLALLAISCGSPKSALDSESQGNEQIPASFNPAAGTLLIEQEMNDSKPANEADYWMRKKKKDMMEYADNNHKFKHEFASAEDIYDKTSKYADKKSYRYALVTSSIKPSDRWTDKGIKQSSAIFRFYLYDRLEGKTYSALGNGSSLIMAAFKSAINKLNVVK